MSPRTFIIAGATASGKTALSLKLAEYFDGEIVSCDSVQIYKKFDIGSAKVDKTIQKKIPHYMIDVAEAYESFDADQYRQQASAAIAKIHAKNKAAIVVGGSGMYLRALMHDRWHVDIPTKPDIRENLKEQDTGDLYKELQNKDPERAAEIHINDRFRIIRALEIITATGKKVSEHWREQNNSSTPSWLHDCVKILLWPSKTMLQKNILLRTQEMLEHGFLEEVETLLKIPNIQNNKSLQSVGYKEAINYLNNEQKLSLETLREEIMISTRQYAKRQITWFKKMEFDWIFQENYDLSFIADFVTSRN